MNRCDIANTQVAISDYVRLVITLVMHHKWIIGIGVRISSDLPTYPLKDFKSCVVTPFSLSNNQFSSDQRTSFDLACVYIMTFPRNISL